MVDIARLETGLLERVASRRLSKLGGMPQPRIVTFREGIEAQVLIDGERQVTSADAKRALNPVEM